MTGLTQGSHPRLEERRLARQADPICACVSGVTPSHIPGRGYLPPVEILFRLAGNFRTPRDPAHLNTPSGFRLTVCAYQPSNSTPIPSQLPASTIIQGNFGPISRSHPVQNKILGVPETSA